jgi:hypothetical protein
MNVDVNEMWALVFTGVVPLWAILLGVVATVGIQWLWRRA